MLRKYCFCLFGLLCVVFALVACGGAPNVPAATPSAPAASAPTATLPPATSTAAAATSTTAAATATAAATNAPVNTPDNRVPTIDPNAPNTSFQTAKVLDKSVKEPLTARVQPFPGLLLSIAEIEVASLVPLRKEELDRISLSAKKMRQRLVHDLAEHQAGGRDARTQVRHIVEAVLLRAMQVFLQPRVREVRQRDDGGVVRVRRHEWALPFPAGAAGSTCVMLRKRPSALGAVRMRHGSRKSTPSAIV